ncbi:hypothetical protein YC2023_077224 [Brassica napus]
MAPLKIFNAHDGGDHGGGYHVLMVVVVKVFVVVVLALSTKKSSRRNDCPDGLLRLNIKTKKKKMNRGSPIQGPVFEDLKR